MTEEELEEIESRIWAHRYPGAREVDLLIAEIRRLLVNESLWTKQENKIRAEERERAALVADAFGKQEPEYEAEAATISARIRMLK